MKKGGGLTIVQETTLKNKGAPNNLIRELKRLPNNGYNSYIAEIIKGYNNKIIKNNNKIINLKLIFTIRNHLNEGVNNRVIEYEYTFTTINSLMKKIKEIIGEDNIIANIISFGRDIYNRSKNTFKNTFNNKTVKNISILNILVFKKLNPEELARSIIKDKSGIENISVTKPVATLNSQSWRPFDIMWPKYSEREREKLKYELSTKLNIKINIFMKEGESPIFYSEDFFPILGDVYGYDLEEAFDVLSGSIKNNNKKRDFVYTSFGDVFKNNKPDNIILTNNGQKKFEQYYNMCI